MVIQPLPRLSCFSIIAEDSMAVNDLSSFSCSQKLNLLINHGSEKHSVSLNSEKPDDVFTVLNLAEYVEENLGVPRKSQKLIYKGKVLQDMSASLSSYGIKSGSKIMLIGRKFFLEDDPNFKMLVKIDETVDVLQKQLGILLEDFNGIQQGYLKQELVLESVNKLIKKTKGIIEEYMKKIELIDSLEVDTFLRNRRKNLVLKIQSMIDKADEFVEVLKAYLLKGNND